MIPLIRITADRPTLEKLYTQLLTLDFPLRQELLDAIQTDIQRIDESWKDIKKYKYESKPSDYTID